MINQELESQLRSAGYKGGLNLEELIEACGEDFGGLIRHIATDRKGWEAWPHARKDVDGVFAPTPSEAVANLWLELKTPN